VTLDDCEEVMRRLPTTLATATRRQVGQLLVEVFSMAVYPLWLIAASPLPSKGFLQAISKQKRSRISTRAKTCGLCGAPTCQLPTGALNVGVLRALRVYFEDHRPGASADDHVFIDPNGEPLTGPDLASLLRDHLRVIKLDTERPELFATTAHRRQICVHDLRGTFVTVSLANGKSEAWVMARTGHKSSAMIARYRRVARTFEEINAGDFTPLDEAIPELSIGPRMGRETSTDSADLQDLAGKLVGHLGVEPRANGLRIHCSTN
jgi:hypothetical protein